MRFYTQPHAFYCGIDLHARWMYLCILDPQGEVLLHRNLRDKCLVQTKVCCQRSQKPTRHRISIVGDRAKSSSAVFCFSSPRGKFVLLTPGGLISVRRLQQPPAEPLM